MQRQNHIDVKFHKIRELVFPDEIVLIKVDTADNVVNMLIKHMTIEKFKQCLDLINISICYKGDDFTYLA